MCVCFHTSQEEKESVHEHSKPSSEVLVLVQRHQRIEMDTTNGVAVSVCPWRESRRLLFKQTKNKCLLSIKRSHSLSASARKKFGKIFSNLFNKR